MKLKTHSIHEFIKLSYSTLFNSLSREKNSIKYYATKLLTIFNIEIKGIINYILRIH